MTPIADDIRNLLIYKKTTKRTFVLISNENIEFFRELFGGGDSDYFYTNNSCLLNLNKITQKDMSLLQEYLDYFILTEG